MIAILLICFICAFDDLKVKQIEASSECFTNKTSPLKLFVNNGQNENGDWISQVGLEQLLVTESSASSVQVEHRVSSCSRSESTLHVLMTVTVAAPPPPVRNDYEHFAGVGYYKFHNIAKAFEQARQICADEGAHLAVINSEKESKVLVTLLSRVTEVVGTQKHLAYVGIQRIGEDHFSILGPALKDTGFARWSPGEPNRGQEYCVTINKINGGLLDISCNYNGAFICEQ